MMAGDVFERAREELYAAALDDFADVRGRLVADARAAAGPAVAKKIQALRKPTRSAWTVNRFARTGAAALAELFELGDALREAQSALDGPQLRELSAQRRQVVDALVAQALSDTGADHCAGRPARRGARHPRSAALADPSIRADVSGGVLVRPAHWSGFGDTDGPALSVVAGSPDVPAAPAMTAAERRRADAERREQERTAAAQALARDNAERAVAAAGEELGAAVEAEKQAERTVRLAQDQLADARRRLDEVRLDVRHARSQQTAAVKALRELS